MQCAVYSVQCIVCSVQCAVCSVQSAVYRVQCSIVLSVLVGVTGEEQSEPSGTVNCRVDTGVLEHWDRDSI